MLLPQKKNIKIQLSVPCRRKDKNKMRGKLEKFKVAELRKKAGRQ
jgi:hypothetical protein